MTELPDDRDVAVDMLVDVLRINRIDARIRLNNVPAIWPASFTEDAARNAASQLESLGATVAAIPAASVPDLRLAQTLHHVRCEPSGLVIMSIAGDAQQTIAWSNLALLSVADVGGIREESASDLPDGVFRHAPGIASSTPRGEHGLEMWLISTAPWQMFRIDAELMNYEYLADRLSPATTANFAHLVQDVRRHAPQLALTLFASEYLSNPSGVHRSLSSIAHRDAVAAFWVVQPRGSASATGESSSDPVRPDTGSTASARSDDRLYQTHRRLHEELDELRRRCTSAWPEEATDEAALMRLVDDLRVTVDEHFRLEEEGGYLESILTNSPRYSQMAASLQRQHRVLKDRLKRIGNDTPELLPEIQDFIKALEAHEHAENALVQSAVLDDVGAAD